MALMWKAGLIEKPAALTVYQKCEDRLLRVTVTVPQPEAQTCDAAPCKRKMIKFTKLAGLTPAKRHVHSIFK